MSIRFNKLFKNALRLLLVTLLTVFVAPNVAISAPERLSSDAKSTTNNLVTSWNLPKQKSFPSNSRKFLIQGNGEDGVEVTVLFYNKSTNFYEKKAENDDDCNNDTIGPLHTFRIQVDLKEGSNKLMVVAQKGKQLQLKKIEIVYGKSSSNDFDENDDYQNFSAAFGRFIDK